MAQRSASLAIGPGLFLAAFLLASTAALAAPITLVCSNDLTGPVRSITVDLDETAGLLTVNYPATVIPNGEFAPIVSEAHSDGPLTAIFDPKTVTVDEVLKNNNYGHFTLDRVTGAFTLYYSMNAPWDRAAPVDKVLYQYTCHPGKAQF